MNNQRQSVANGGGGRGALRRMNTDNAGVGITNSTVRADIRTRRSTESDKRASQELQLGKSTQMILTKIDDTRRNSASRNYGGLDKSDRSVKSDGFMPLPQENRRSSVDKSMRRRSNSCDNMEEMYAMQMRMEAEKNMGQRTSSADNLAEMIAISRQSLLSGGNPRAMNTRQSQVGAGQRRFDRRNTYKEPPKAQPLKESTKPRRTTCVNEKLGASTTLKVLTKKEGSNRASSQFKSSDSLGSAKSDGVTFPLENEASRRSTVKRYRIMRRTSSLDNISDWSATDKPPTSADNEMIARMNPRQSQIGSGQNATSRRNTYKAPSRNVSSDDLKSRRVTVPTQRTNQPRLGKSTPQMVLTKKEGRGSPSRNNKMGLDKSDRSAKSEGFLPGLDLSRNSPQPKLQRKRSSSVDNFGDTQRAPLAPDHNSRSNTSSDRAPRGNAGNSNLYDTVLMDLFSSIAATSQSKGFKNTDLSVRSGDEELDAAFSRQNSAFHSTPSPNVAPKVPINIDTLLDQTQMPLTSSQSSDPKLHHKRSSSGDAVAPFFANEKHTNQPLKSSNRSKEDVPRANPRRENAGKGEKKPAPDNLSEMATGENSIAKKEAQLQPQAKNNSHDLKLYDELSHSSDPKIGKWIGVPDGTTSTEPDPSFLMRSMSGGYHKGDHLDELEEHRSRKCRPYTRLLIVGLLLLLAGLGIGGYFMFFHDDASQEIHSDKESSNISAEADASPVANDTSANSNQSNSTVIAPPPSDIEGRCSASNLPGALSACLAACMPSACCYPGFVGETCFDNSGCNSYKPHCDAFYDAWMGSTEGVLREVTDEMVKMCFGTQNIIINDSPPLPASTGVKRLRGHVQRYTKRHLQTSSYQETCEQYCIAARCCSAPTITNLELSGVIFSPTGVYTNATSGDYVMTNCQASNSNNIQLCTQYAAFCSTDEVTSQGLSNSSHSLSPAQTPVISNNNPAPVASPSSSSPTTTNTNLSNQGNADSGSNQTSSGPTVSITNSPNQSNVDSGDNQASTGPTISNTNPSNQPNEDEAFSSVSHTPSQSTIPVTSSTQNSNETVGVPNESEVVFIVPPARVQEIQEACASSGVALLIQADDIEARSRCTNACQLGLCCFADQLGYSWMDSCFQGNEQACTEYSTCLILQQQEVLTNSSSEILWADNSTLVVNQDGSNETLPENAVVNVTSDVALNNSFAEDNSTSLVKEPFQENTVATVANTTSIIQETDQENTTAIANQTISVQIPGPPTPEQDLVLLCSEVSISQISGLTQCLTACDLGSCCDATDETECLTTHAEICYLYTPCNNAYSLLYPNNN